MAKKPSRPNKKAATENKRAATDEAFATAEKVFGAWPQADVPAPHAIATCFDVWAPRATASHTSAPVTPWHKQTYIVAGSQLLRAILPRG